MSFVGGWISSLGAPLTLTLGSLGLMIYSLTRPRWMSSASLGLGVGTLVIHTMFSQAGFKAPTHDLIAQGWIHGIQTCLLGGWVLYSALLWSFETRRREALLSHDVWLLLILSLVGMMWCLHAQTFLTLFLGLEIMTLPLYITAGAFREWDTAPEAALKYFVLGSVGSIFILFGASFLYGATQSLDLAAWVHYTPVEVCSCCHGEPLLEPLFWVGSVFVIAGLLFKISIVPFHMWTPDVYGGVPLALTGFYTLFPKVTIAGVFTRLNAEMGPYVQDTLSPVLVVLGGASVMVGALGTLRQHHLGRLMGYSSILNSGFLLWGMSLPQGVTPVLIFVLGYGLSLLGMVSILAFWNFPLTLKDLQGIGQQNPWSAVSLTVFVGSWMGLPPLAGFWGKFQILSLLMSQHHLKAAIIGVVGSVIGSYYGLRLIQAVWFDPPLPDAPTLQPKASSHKFQGVIGLLMLLTLGFMGLMVMGEPWIQRITQALAYET